MIARLDARELRARPWLPADAPAWSFWVGPDGTTVRVNADGSTTTLFAAGHPRPGVAWEPAAARGTR
jgi:hypothetical protein